MLLWKNDNAFSVCRIAIAGDYLPTGGLTLPGGNTWSKMAHNLAGYFDDIDLSIVNLECPIDVGSLAPRPKLGLGDSFSASESSLDYLTTLRVAVVGLANNHAYDFGHSGLERTKQALLAKRMTPLGTGKSLEETPDITVVEGPSGLRLGVWAAACPLPELATRKQSGIEPATRERAARAMRELTRNGAHVSIALLHLGLEHTNRPDPADVALMDDLAGFGFDVVAACHSHRMSGYRLLSRTSRGPAVCFYGLGSLSSGVIYSSLERESILLVVGLDRHGSLAQVEAHPIYLADSGWGTVPDRQKAQIIDRRFHSLSQEIATGAYKAHFYHDVGKDLFRRQLRDAQVAFRRGGFAGLFKKIGRLRARHLSRVLHIELG